MRTRTGVTAEARLEASTTYDTGTHRRVQQQQIVDPIEVFGRSCKFTAAPGETSLEPKDFTERDDNSRVGQTDQDAD